MRWMLCFLMPTVLSVVCVGCDCSGSAGAPKRGESRPPETNVQPTSSDGVSPMVRVECNLSLTRTNERIVAELDFKNASEIPVGIPHWNLIADGQMTWGAFEVARGVTDIPYRGVMIKRKPPTDADRIILSVGGTYSSRATISESYDFTDPGRYRVQYSALVLGQGSVG